MRSSLLLIPVLLTGCVIVPPPRPPATHVALVRPQEVYFYPQRGQSATQTDRDHFECHEWAVKQSRFDPSLPTGPAYRAAPTLRDPAPARDTVTGTVAGAAVGAAVADHPGEGAVVGAVAGAMLGAAADQQRGDAIARANAEADARNRRFADVENAGYARYRRALAACGAGRGYEVR